MRNIVNFFKSGFFCGTNDENELSKTAQEAKAVYFL
jgi:hypothetical protein